METLKNIIVKIKEKVMQHNDDFENNNKEEKDTIFSKLEGSIFSVDNLITLFSLILLIGGIYLFNYVFLGGNSDNNNTTDSVVAIATTESSVETATTTDDSSINKRVSSSHIRASLREQPIKNSRPKKEDFSINEYLPELPDMSNLITYDGAVETIKAVVDRKSYRQSDLLIIGDTKIWFGKNSIKINEDELCIKGKNRLICRLEGVDVSNPKIVRQLTRQKIGKIKIGRHKKETWIVVTPNSSYSNNFEIKEVSGREYEEEIVFHKKYSTNRRVSPVQTNYSTANSSSISQSKVKHWDDSDGLYLGSEFVATFKRDRVTVERGSCSIENSKWICTIPNKKVQWEDISRKIRHLNAIESVKLNLDSRTKRDARVIITPKYGYRVVKKMVNGKEVLVFERR